MIYKKAIISQKIKKYRCPFNQSYFNLLFAEQTKNQSTKLHSIVYIGDLMIKNGLKHQILPDLKTTKLQ